MRTCTCTVRNNKYMHEARARVFSSGVAVLACHVSHGKPGDSVAIRPGTSCIRTDGRSGQISQSDKHFDSPSILSEIQNVGDVISAARRKDTDFWKIFLMTLFLRRLVIEQK